MQKFFEKLKSLLPGAEDSQPKRYFKIIIYVILGMMVVMVAAGLLVYFLNLDALEKTQVPDISANEYNQTDILSAITKLQEKGLNVRLQLKHSSIYSRGIVIDQKPKAGSLVKVGRYVTLTVSEGGIINKVADYRGKKLDWVRIDLQQTFASDENAMLKIDDTQVEYIFDQSEPGTILSQEPVPGTELVESKVTMLQFKVSKGAGGLTATMDSFLGMDWNAALLKLAKMNISFTMSEETDENKVRAGRVTYQSPKRGTDLTPESQIEIRYNPPDKVEEGKVYGIYKYSLRQYDINVKIKLEIVDSDGRSPFLLMEHRGGMINIPYVLEENAEISLYIFNDLVDTQFVHKKDS